MTILFFLQFLTRLTERFVLGVDMFVETLWKVWMELLDVLGLDGTCVCVGGIHLRRCFILVVLEVWTQCLQWVAEGTPWRGAGGHK